MDRRYAEPLAVADIAHVAHMSPAHFTRRFRAAYGETPHAYLMTRRVERAQTLLRTTSISVTDACLAVGCTSLGSFSASFTRIVGATPSAYRAHAHELAALPACTARAAGRPAR